MLVISQALSRGGGPSAEPIRSVELAGAKVSLMFRHGDLDVLVSEIGARSSLSDACHGGGFSWHLVVEGRALFEQGDQGWEALPFHSFRLAGAQPYRVVNLGEGQLRLLSIVVGAATTGESVAA